MLVDFKYLTVKQTIASKALAFMALCQVAGEIGEEDGCCLNSLISTTQGQCFRKMNGFPKKISAPLRAWSRERMLDQEIKRHWVCRPPISESAAHLSLLQ